MCRPSMRLVAPNRVQQQVRAYDRGENPTSTGVLVKLAEVFNVKLDYLAFEGKGQSASLHIQDRELPRHFEEVDTVTDKEKNRAREFLNLVIPGHRFRELSDPKAAIG